MAQPKQKLKPTAKKISRPEQKSRPQLPKSLTSIQGLLRRIIEDMSNAGRVSVGLDFRKKA